MFLILRGQIICGAWVDLGEEQAVLDARVELLKPYRITMELLQKTNVAHPLFLHCLPAMHDNKTKVGKYVYDKFGLDGIEVTDEVFRSSHSVVFNEAENRK
jgi:ornithine carbamoyltransferase